MQLMLCACIAWPFNVHSPSRLLSRGEAKGTRVWPEPSNETREIVIIPCEGIIAMRIPILLKKKSCDYARNLRSLTSLRLPQSRIHGHKTMTTDYQPTWKNLQHPLRHKIAHWLGWYQVYPIFKAGVAYDYVRYCCVTCGKLEDWEQLL